MIINREFIHEQTVHFCQTREEGKGGGLEEGGVSPLVSVRQSDLMDTSVTARSDPAELILKLLSFGFVSELIVMYPGCGRDQ